jgi:hypothetical protein
LVSAQDRETGKKTLNLQFTLRIMEFIIKLCHLK